MFVYRIYFHVCILITAHFSFEAKIIFCHAVKSQQAFIYLLLSGMKVAKKNRHSLKQERKKTDGAKIYSNWLKQNRDVHIFIEYQSKSWFWWNYEKIVLEYMIFFMNLPIVRFLNEWYDPISSDTRYLFHDRSEKMILWSLLVSKVDWLSSATSRGFPFFVFIISLHLCYNRFLGITQYILKMARNFEKP